MTNQELLYGKDDEQRLVGLHEEEDQFIRLYSRDEDDNVTSRRERVYPFLFSSDKGRVTLSERFSSLRSWELEGDGYYRWLYVFDSISEWRAAKRELAREEYYTVNQINTQYLMQTGKTLFKGMSAQDIHRMQIDIETITDHGFPNAERDEDEIIIIAMHDNRGWKKVLYQGCDFEAANVDVYEKCTDERDLLEQLVRYVHRRDPDTMELHNGFGFDLPYLETRAKKYGVNLALGRDSKSCSVWPAKKDFAERTFEHMQRQYGGRSVIDTMFLAVDYDVYKRDLPGYGLKAIAKHFGVAPENRAYIEGDNLTQLWRENPAKVLIYALHDVVETEGIGHYLMNATFALTQIVPFDFQRVTVAGKSALIESLFVREYLRGRKSLPQSMPGQMKVGGYTEVFQRGVFTEEDNGLNYADVESLYPSIMLFYNIQPKGDYLQIFPTLLQMLTSMRFEAKGLMKKLEREGKEHEASVVDSKQAAFKILINSFYGMLGHGGSIFNDFYEADRVTTTGQMLLKRMIELITLKGGDVVLVDTDGVLYCLPRPNMTDDEVDAFVKEISDLMPEGINIGNDGRFSACLSYMKKNYVLKERDSGKVKFKGVSFKSRGIEQFGRQYQREVALSLLERDVDKIHNIHRDVLKKLVTRDYDVKWIQSRANLKKTLAEYQRDITKPSVNRSAPYELALRRNRQQGTNLGAGDVVHYFMGSPTKSKSRLRAFEDAEFSDQWWKGADHTGHYLDRLKTFAAKFEVFFKPEDFTRIFDMDTESVHQNDLFGVGKEPDFSDVEILRTRLLEP